jgi:serine protease Do
MQYGEANMFKASRMIANLVLVMLPLLAVAHNAQAGQLPGFTELIKETAPAVVNISTTQKVQSGTPQLPEGFEIPDFPEDSPFGELFKYFFEHGRGDGVEPDMRDAKSLGSGSIISEDGYIMTNYHVIKDADEIIVRLNDHRELRAKVIGADQRSDIALVKIEASDLPVVKIGKSADLEVGEWVLAIGSPFGFDYSATAGIVSAKGRSLPKENYVPFIQTDVAINPGNSGGPLFNQDGEVVGVNSQIYSRTGGYMGLSFAIPIEVAMDVADQLKTKGRVTRGWLGVLIQDVTHDLAESFGMDHPRGALVAKVLPDSPAKTAGLQVGDVIINFDGKDIRSSSSLPPIVGSTRVGVDVPVDVIRKSKTLPLKVKLGELPDDLTKVSAAKPLEEQTSRLGLGVDDLTDEQKLELETEHGVLVQRLVKGAAASAGVQKGDIILSLNNEQVKDAEHFRELVEDLPAGKSVALLIQRNGGPTFLAMRVPEAD